MAQRAGACARGGPACWTTGGSGSAPASWVESAGAGAVIRVSTRPERRRSPHRPRLRSGLAGPQSATSPRGESAHWPRAESVPSPRAESATSPRGKTARERSRPRRAGTPGRRARPQCAAMRPRGEGAGRARGEREAPGPLARISCPVSGPRALPRSSRTRAPGPW